MTVKVPPRGTRGARFPRFLGRISGFAAWMFRHGQSQAIGGTRTLILETRGARSGQRRQAILGYFPEPPDAWLVIASIGAASWNPAWLHNLAADPNATIELPGRERIEVRAETLEGADLQAAWQRIATESHQYSDYRAKTDREIAIIRLRRRPDA
jgi:deazaflavin-dependent oxidoreductase (nitroreductase family)